MSKLELELERAMAGFDEAFEARLVGEITKTIAAASTIDNVIVIRTGEAAAALTTVLASILALSPASTRTRAAIKQVADAFRKKLVRQVRAAERNADVLNFKSRCFHDGDRDRGGNA